MTTVQIDREWVKERVQAVSEKYDVYDALVEHHVELDGKETTTQIPCPLPGHGQDNKPSARYYAADGLSPAHFYCFKCRENLKGIDLYARLHGLEFMRALAELERRFGIHIQQKTKLDLNVPRSKTGDYESEAWSDVPRFLEILEAKVIRLRDDTPMLDYIKWCRVLDAVRWDFSHNGGNATPDMISILMRLKDIMNAAKIVR